jgi:hypothetical protein
LKPQSDGKGKAMAEIAKTGVPWRIVGWGGAVGLLAIPFIAMRFTSEVHWTAGDFIFAGLLFAVVGGGFELAVRKSRNFHYRLGAALALLGTLLTIWANLAVGIVGSEDNPANMWFFAALLVGVTGSVIARFRASGMSITMLATALSLWAALAVASTGPTDEPWVNHGVELAGTAIFALLFLASAALFRKAAKT